MLNLQITALTHKGMVRDNNEDNHIFAPDLGKPEWCFYEQRRVDPLGKAGALLVVADGMGGLEAGEVASQLAIEGIEEYFGKKADENFSIDTETIRSFLFEAINHANQKIISHQQVHPSASGMGTTIVMAWITGTKLFLSWSGDSRCYRFNTTSGLEQLSKDHSYVQELIDKGKLTRESAFYHPDTNIITQSLGDQKHPPSPGFEVINLKIHDRIILCSDGLNSMIPDTLIRDTVQKNDNIQSCAQALIDEANKAGGGDNITVMLCDILALKEEPENKVKGKPGKRKILLILGLLVITALLIIFPGNGLIKKYCGMHAGDSLSIKKRTTVSDSLHKDSLIRSKGDTLKKERDDPEKAFPHGNDSAGIKPVIKK